jgi:hypothetical protein
VFQRMFIAYIYYFGNHFVKFLLSLFVDECNATQIIPLSQLHHEISKDEY